MEEKFIKGLFLNRRENAPDFVKGNVSIKVEDFINWLTENQNEKGYVNIDLLEGSKGLYFKKNDWKPNSDSVEEAINGQIRKQDEIDLSQIPF